MMHHEELPVYFQMNQFGNQYSYAIMAPYFGQLSLMKR